MKNNDEKIVEIIEKFPINYLPRNKKIYCYEANLKKIKALVLFRLDQRENFEKIYNLLNESYDIFEKYYIPHGLAVISYIKSFFLFSKQSEFYFIYRNDAKTL